MDISILQENMRKLGANNSQLDCKTVYLVLQGLAMEKDFEGDFLELYTSLHNKIAAKENNLTLREVALERDKDKLDSDRRAFAYMVSDFEKRVKAEQKELEDLRTSLSKAQTDEMKDRVRALHLYLEAVLPLFGAKYSINGRVPYFIAPARDDLRFTDNVDRRTYMRNVAQILSGVPEYIAASADTAKDTDKQETEGNHNEKSSVRNK